ncbi:hypothetical protein [Streptomyces sp. NPDC002044]|uniref:hypothetical protein n=1 Tax=Streptomyces sp. NPDC002044 TaxID=3154662 RepID=UPI003327621F
MKIFISWSGVASRKCAEVLRGWLPYMNPSITPFVSSQDISKGERGLITIATELKDCSFGIVCVTRENQAAPWINFESGAISRELGEGMLAPFLVDMPIRDLSSPLAQFQATDSTNSEDVWAMVKSINARCSVTVDSERLRTTFGRFWGDLEISLNELRKESPKNDLPERETSDILNELVGLVREQSSRVNNLASLIAHADESRHQYVINEPREVTINREETRPSPAKSEYLARQVQRMLGPEAVVKCRAFTHGISVQCSEHGFIRALEIREELESLAVKSQLFIDINTESEKLSFPPF